MQRVMIVGQPGSGKSTLARKMGAVTGLPVFHMDLIHWRPNWVERTAEDKRRLVHDVHMQEAWILEGGFSATFAERMARADTFVWLDTGFSTRVWRVLWRTVKHYNAPRPDLPAGCVERFDAQKMEFLRYIWRTRGSARAKLAALAADAPPHLATHVLTSSAEVDGFLAGLSAVARDLRT